MNQVIKADGISKRYGSQTALHQISFQVKPGVVFALLGENGAGKTTAIRILLGLESPDAGTAEVMGHDSTQQGLQIRRTVGYVAERPTLYEWMSVDEIGWFAAGFYADGYLSRYHELTSRFDLPRSRKIRFLSKGMRAKVSLALALALDPDLLVLDEPTSGLDTLVRREFLESMVDRAAAGKTVVLASHQIHEVERVADVVAIVRGGRLLLVERLDALKSEAHEITITLKNETSRLPPAPDGVLRQQRRGRQWQLLIRCPEQSAFRHLEKDPLVEELAVRTPSLEDIFAAYMLEGDEGAIPAAGKPGADGS